MFINRVSRLVLLILVPLTIAFCALGLWQWDLSIPFAYHYYDDIWQLVTTKGLLDSGWILSYPYLGAPSEASWHYHSAPQSSALHSVLMTPLGWMFNDAVVVQQLYYLFNFSLISITSYLAFRLIKAERFVSFVLAICFAFITYRFNTIFFSYLSNYFMVPLAIVICFKVASGGFFQHLTASEKNFFISLVKDKRFYLSIFVCVLIAISDGYYAFFTLLLLGFSAIVGFFILPKDKLKTLTITGFFCSTILISNAIIMSPNNAYKEQNKAEFYPNGVVESATIKRPMEAEVYSTSLKLLLAPIIDHRIQTIADLGRYIIQTNYDARKFPAIRPIVSLGTLGGIAFLVCLVSLCYFSPNNTVSFERRKLFLNTRILSLFAVFVFLTSISGGIGTLIALVFPTIRAYDRFPLFLIFIVFSNLALLWTYYGKRLIESNFRRTIFLLCVCVLTLLDQIPSTAFKPITMEHVERFKAEKRFIEKIESSLPASSMVYQYPYSQYLTDNKYYGWGAFSHLRAYLHSSKLRWSNGASKNSPVDNWHQGLATLNFYELIDILNTTEFRGVLIDLTVVDESELENIRLYIEEQLDMTLKVDLKAKLAYFELPPKQFALKYSVPDMEIKSLLLYENSKLSNLPSYLNTEIIKNKLDSLSTSESSPTEIENDDSFIDMRQYKLLFEGLNEKLKTEQINGNVICDVVDVQLDKSSTVRLKVENTGDFDWILNKGLMPITLGFLLYDTSNNVINTTANYRFKEVVKVNAGKAISVEVPLGSIEPSLSNSSELRLNINLLQEGNVWFNINSQNTSCNLTVRKKGGV